MPVDLEWEPAGVRRRYRGHVTVQQRLASFEAICADPRFDDLRYTITSYLEVDHYEVTRHDTEEIAALHIAPSRINPRILIAAVAIRPDILQAIHHFRSLQFTDQPYQVFSTEAAARLWIEGSLGALRSVPAAPRPHPPRVG